MPQGISRLVPRETVTCFYETGPESAADPRVQRDLVLEVNDYGDLLRTMKLSYGRSEEKAKADMILNENARRQQTETIATITEKTYTNAVTELASFRKPLVCTTKQFRLSGMKREFASFDELAALDIEHFDLVDHNDLITAKGQCRALIKESRVIYTSNDSTNKLDHGRLEAYSRQLQRFDLCATPDIVKSIEDTFGIGEELRERGGYALPDATAGWWTASARLGYKNSEDTDQAEYARRSFFIPNTSTDSFGNSHTAKLNKHCLLLEELEDPLGNTIKTRNDYRCLQPTEITDCNGNRQKVVLNAFAEVVGFGLMGKSGEQVGESLEDFDDFVSPETIQTLLQAPTQELLRGVLGNATRRVIHQRNRYHDSNSLRRLPNFVAELSRQDHDDSELPSPIMLNIQYLSGRAGAMETYGLLSEKGPQWRISGREILDNTGTAVRTFQSRLAANCEFCKHDEIATSSMFVFLDALGRRIGSLAADGLWTKTRRRAWSQDVFDSGNTVLLDASTDEDIGIYVKSLDPAYLSSWYQSRTASVSKDEVKSAKKLEVSVNMHITQSQDSMGNQILIARRLGPAQILHERVEYDALGMRSSVYDVVERGGQLAQRLTERYVYDLLGRQITWYSLDAGDLWSLSDSNGSPMVAYNSRKITRQVFRDELRRESKITMRQDEDAKERTVLCFEYGRSPEDEVRNCRNRQGLWSGRQIKCQRVRFQGQSSSIRARVCG